MKPAFKLLVVVLAAMLAIGAGNSDEDSSLPLHDAIKHKDLDSFVGLLQDEHDPNKVNSEGQTVLHLAVSRMQDRGFTFATESLRFGADIDARDATGATALRYAAANGSVALAAELIRLGANVHTTTDGGGTALGAAYLHGHMDIARLLESHGASVGNQKNGFVAMGVAATVERELHERARKFSPADNARWTREKLRLAREKHNLHNDLTDNWIENLAQEAYKLDARPELLREASK